MGDQVANTVYKDRDVQKFIFIFDDGTIKQDTSYTVEDLQACNAGDLQIVRVSDMTTYYESTWHPIDSL